MKMCGELGRHVDPGLLRKRVPYGKFVRYTHSTGLMSYTLTCRCQLGLFFVFKKI